MARLRIAFVTAELAPFSKTGGLADVTSALSRLLEDRGHDVQVFTPFYPRVAGSPPAAIPDPRLQDIPVKLGARSFWFSVSTGMLPRSRVPVHFVRCPELFGRETIYTNDPDEHLRFGLLGRAALTSCQWMQWAPDVLHCHDWHAALVPLQLRTTYGWDRLFERTRTVLTIHNLPHQGIFPAAAVGELGLEGERHLLHQEDLTAGRINFLKTGILYADALTTVSEGYAREIQTPEHGAGLDGLLRSRSASLFGILNGVDYGEWNPETDALIPHHYSVRDMRGKARNKRELLRRAEFPDEPAVPLLGMVSRLVGQKGVELVPPALRSDLLRQGAVRLVVLGNGQREHEEAFRDLAAEMPDKVAYRRGYDEPLAHLIEAGSDIFLMPSRYEPAGLNQMYSLRYGTIPVVRRTGGLADTVRPYDPVRGEGTGFLFDEYRPEALYRALTSALEVYRDPAAWKGLMRNAMNEDFSWTRSVERYERLYEQLAAR